MKSLNVCVIGGAGFIGSVLCRRMENTGDHVLKVLDKVAAKDNNRTNVKADVRDLDALKEHFNGSDCLINLAAEHKDNVSPISLYYDVNVDGAANVCEAAEANGINKIVFTSSVAVYGLNKPNPAEDFAPDPFNDYGKSKLEAEEVYIKWQQKAPEERSLVIIRPTVVFGEGNRGNVYNLLKQIASGRFLRIGSGNNKKSMAYVENVAGFVEYSVNNLGAGIHTYNYVDKPDLSMNELVSICEESLNKSIPKIKIPYAIGLMGGVTFDIVSKVLGREFPISAVRIKKFCATTQFDSAKVMASGFKPPYELADALDRTLKSEF